MGRIISLAWVVVGVFVAHGHGYLNIDTLPHALSAVAAIALWPLLFFGVDLRFGN